METTIRPRAVLIFLVIYMLAAPRSDAGRSFGRTAPFGQASGSNGGTQVFLTDKTLNRLSSMGRLAYLAATGRLNGDGTKTGTTGDADNNNVVAGGEAQPSIAVDSTGQHIVIGTNDAAGFGLNPVSVSGFRYSDDGGQTFTDGGPLPVNSPTSVIGSTVYPQVFGDPDVKYVGGSTFIYFSIILVNAPNGGPSQSLGFHRSTDFGHTWTGPFEIPPATNPNGLLNGLSVELADKPFADVDPDTGRVLVSWSNFTPFALGGVEISTTFSDDILDANPVWSPRNIVAATEIDGQSSIPRFAGNGSSNVYVAWQRFAGDNSDDVGFARSTDNGATWSDPVNAPPSAFFTMDQVLGDDRVSSAPGLAIDNSTGPGKGNIYLVYSNNNLKDGADIVFQRSTDGGLSFTSPILINSRPGSDRAQWFPWVTVDNSSGRIYVFYYDQGIDSSGDLTQTTYQFSDNGGLTWKPPMPLTDRPFKAGWGKDQGHPNLGDYNQAVAQNGEFFPVWAGTELLPFTSGLPSIHMQTPKPVFKRVPAGSMEVTLTSNFSGTTFTDGNGNGFIDAGEQVRFKFPLTNYVTNPALNPNVVTGIVATLSATTSTVTIVQGTSGYPSIAPGNSAINDQDFIVQISPDYVKGTPLCLSLRISSNQGSTVLLFTHATGAPQATTIFQEDFSSTVPGTLPLGWLTQHVGGANTVPWTTTNAFNVGDTGAFHINANDGLRGDSNRWERLLSPLIAVPPESEYVTLDFDAKYDTQDDPNFNILAYDGFLLRIGDYGPTDSAPPSPPVIRAVMAEAFEEEFTTDNLKHYPKHFPRSNSTAYFQDLSAWAGDSAGLKHVHMKLNGMAGRSIRLWWEFTQDTTSTCNDAPVCGVLFDNLVVQSVVTLQADWSVTKSITSGPAISGQNITYDIDAVNNGPTFNIMSTVSDDLPPSLSFVSCSATGGGTCNGTDNHQTVTFPPGTADTRSITLVAAISCSAANGTPLSNTATITSPAPDPYSGNNFSSAYTRIVNPPPVMSCPADIVTTARRGQPSAIVNFTVTATDNCPLAAGSIVSTPPSGSGFVLGTTLVTAGATDSGGDQASCSFNVTVNAPTATNVKAISAQYNDTVTLKAVVSPTMLSAQTATGNVNFFVDGNPVGSSSIDASGVAVLPYTIVQSPGTYPISADFASTYPVFLSSTGSDQLSVARANQRITFAPLGSHVYGDAPFAISASSNSGLAVSLEAAGGCTLSDNLLTIIAAGSCTVTAAQPGDVNYNPATPVSRTFVIRKASASVSPNAGGKPYGSSDPVLTGTLSGFLPSDNVTAIFARTGGENAGTYTISGTVSPVTVLGNYNITFRVAAFVITPLPASVSPNPAGKTFGDADPEPLTTGTLTGFLDADNVTATYIRDAGETPGQYTITPVLSPVSVLLNYNVTYNTADFTIDKYRFNTCDASGHCTGGTRPNDNGIGGSLRIPPTAAYGDNVTASVTLSPAAVNNQDVLTSPGTDSDNQPLPPAFKVWLAPVADPTRIVLFGTGTATRIGPDSNGNSAWQTRITSPLNNSSITPGDYTAYVYGDDGSTLTNYAVRNDAGYVKADTKEFVYPTLTASLTVTQASTRTSIDAPAVTYGARAVVTVTVTSPGGTPSGNVFLTVDDGTPMTATLRNGSANFAITGLNAGDHSLTANYPAQGSYAAGSSTGMLSINPRPVTLTADPKSKTYGDKDPALTYHVTTGSLANGDTVTGALTRVEGNAAGTYAIQQGTLSLTPNYTLTFVGAILTINRKRASATPNAASKTYGDDDPVLTGTLNGFLQTDNVTAAYRRAPGETVAGSPYTISATLKPVEVLGNYDIAFNTANFTIKKATAVLTLSNLSQTYDGNPKPVTITTNPAGLTGVSITYDGSIIPPTGAGCYVVAVSLNNPNYRAQNVGGTLIIAAPTAAGTNVKIPFTVGATTVRAEITRVMSAGTTSVTAIDPAMAGNIPPGFTLSAANLAFNISTTASYSSGIITCFVLRSITDPAQFQSPFPLRILHLESISGSETLVDRTILAGRNAPDPDGNTICDRTSSPGRFVLATALDFTPPKISDLSLGQNPAPVGTAVVLTAKASGAETARSNIALMEYSIDGGSTWQAIGSNYTSAAVTVSRALNLPAAVYSVCIRATDAVQNSSSSCAPILAIYDPGGPSITGIGWIAPAAGKLAFALDAKYKKGSTIPTGDMLVTIQAARIFQSSGYEWLVVSGNRAQLKGSGKINGSGNYGILITAIDEKNNGGSDKLRVKIWNNPEGTIIYDNAPGAGDSGSASTDLGAGDITIHK